MVPAKPPAQILGAFTGAFILVGASIAWRKILLNERAEAKIQQEAATTRIRGVRATARGLRKGKS
ncbi:hypothetical protein ANMWB30_22990 [Arthrobacter sp. MWB30]|nr:hypothetical protein ANMWB30_22990 [Arthrobacter sp. MWB30]